MKLEQVLAMFYTPIYKSARYLTTLEHDSIVADNVKGLIYWNAINRTFNPVEFLKFHGLDDSEIEELGLEFEQELNFNIGQDLDFDYQQQLFYGTVDNKFDYFAQRGLNEQTVKLFNLEVKHNAIIIPHIVNDKRVGAIYRYLTNQKQQRYVIYSNEKIMYWPHVSHYTNAANTAILFEGYFSVMRWQQMLIEQNKNIHTYCLLNARPTYKKLVNFENYRKVYYICDNDDAGITAGLKIKELAKWCKVIVPNKMPDEMSNEEMLNVLKLKNVRIL